MTAEPPPSVDAIAAALDAAFEALRRGDLTELGAHYARTEAILADLRLADSSLTLPLRAKAERNAAGLLAALRGVRAARRRLAEVQRQSMMKTYDAQGQAQSIAPGTDGFRRRF